MAHVFEPLPVGRTLRRAGSSRSTDEPRAFELDDFERSAPEPLSGEPVIAEPAERPLLFDEDELARACAAVVARSARLAAAVLAAPDRDEEAMLRERFLAAVAGLRADLAEREIFVRQTVRDLVTVVLDALLPALREQRLLRALEELVAEVLGAGRPAPRKLMVEVPEGEFEVLAARLPALLAEFGIETGYEIRPLAGGELLRITVDDTWAELDAGALAAALRERVREVTRAGACAVPGWKGDEDARDG